MSREFCYRCWRVASNCICEQAVRIDNRPQVVVLQHPDEKKHSKNTAIIAALCLQNYVCLQGENFSRNQQLNTLIEREADQIVVVFPADYAMPIQQYYDQIAKGRQLEPHVVIFIDASWKKAKKIWAVSENLHQLQTVRLPGDIESIYSIRKVPGTGYLSTVESIALTLSMLEDDKEKYKPMLNLFTNVISTKIAEMGSDVFKKNYLDKKTTD